MRAAATWCATACIALLAPAGTAAAESTSAAGVDDGYVTAPDGMRLYCQMTGTAPQVVLLPGRLFAFADLETVRRHFGIERMALLGYSYLGKIVVLYALEHPDRVERIVQFGAVGPSFATEYRSEFVFQHDPVDPAARARLRALRNEQNHHLSHPREYCEQEWDVVQRPSLVGDASMVDRVQVDVCGMPNEWPILQVRHLRLHFQESGMTHETPIDRVRELQTPVLTVHGTRDRNAPYGGGREWSYWLPQGRLLTVDGAGHHVFAEARETVMPAVLDFLRGDWPAAAVKVTDDPRK